MFSLFSIFIYLLTTTKKIRVAFGTNERMYPLLSPLSVVSCASLNMYHLHEQNKIKMNQDTLSFLLEAVGLPWWKTKTKVGAVFGVRVIVPSFAPDTDSDRMNIILVIMNN